MNIYPALRGKMGRWDYFVVKMTMREVAENVRFATDVHANRTLDEAIQRALNEGRVKKEIVTYLIRQQDRLFASLVVAALGGHPAWFPVTIENDERFALFRDDKRLNATFGLLRFDGTQNYYALDGQHRLAAIKALVEPSSDVYRDAPQGFDVEEISVIVVVPREAETQAEFLKRYRRLFGNLNRYAKPTDRVTNIIMDEDDAFAIVTRRLIIDHPFFAAPQRIKSEKGKNLSRSEVFFTSLETLYDMNIALLNSRNRRNRGWDPTASKLAEFQRFRPDEQFLDELYDELAMYWDAVLTEVPLLEASPPKMRNHDADGNGGQDDDNLLFWPIGQEMFADIVRDALDLRQPDPDYPTRESVKTALAGLGAVNWDLHTPPWRHLFLVPDNSGSWRMRSEERKDAQRVGHRILSWQLGFDELDTEGIQELRRDWQQLLLPALDAPAIEEMWSQVAERVPAGASR